MHHIFMTLLLLVGALNLAAAADESALIERGQALERSRKSAEAKAFYLAHCRDGKLSFRTRKLFLNRVVMYCSGRERALALNLLRQAELCDGGASENYRARLLTGTLLRKSEPEKALSFFLCMDQKDRIHPALVYHGFFGAGQLYEQHGCVGEAVSCYEKALAAARTIQYKFNASEAEKALLRLKQEGKK